MSYFLYIISEFIFFIKCTIFKCNEELFRECIWCKKHYNAYKRSKYTPFCSKRCKSKFLKEKNQRFKHNNRCKKHKFQRLTYKGECWSCYKRNCLKSVKSLKYSNKFRLKLYGFKFIPTFRTSERSWNGDKIAFEKYLKDKHIKWFVYVKFYENKYHRIKPLVVGKSGSMLVNASGSDLNFSTDIRDGPARSFIYHHKFKWFYDSIAIKPCKSEKEAYRIESKIVRTLDLFES